jgi:hypothetical protein
VRTYRIAGIKMTAEELNVDKETVREILTTNLNEKKVCSKMVPKNPPVFSHKRNTSPRTRSVLARSCPRDFPFVPNLKG